MKDAIYVKVKETMLLFFILGNIFLLNSLLVDASTTIFVPDDYPDIQSAIDAANHGDAVFVRKDTYYESLTIDKSIWLGGEDMENTVISGDGVNPVISTGNQRGLVLWNFTVTNGLTDIWLVEVDDTTIYYVVIHNVSSSGIEYVESNDIRIMNCKVHSSLNGIDIDECCDVDIENCETYSCESSGILCNDVTNLFLSNSSSHDNGYGIKLHNLEKPTIKGAQAYYNYFDGIYAAQCHDIYITESSCDSNGCNGIKFEQSKGVIANSNCT